MDRLEGISSQNTSDSLNILLYDNVVFSLQRSSSSKSRFPEAKFRENQRRRRILENIEMVCLLLSV